MSGTRIVLVTLFILAAFSSSVFADVGVAKALPGLGNHHLNAVAINSTGFIYFAGNDGVFGVYNPFTNHTTNLTSRVSGWVGTYNINAIAINGSGVVYIGAEGGVTHNLGVYYPSTNTSVGLKNNVPIKSLVVNSSGAVYFGIQNNGLDVYIPSTDTVSAVYNNFKTVYSLAINASDAVFVGSADGKFASYNSNTGVYQGLDSSDPGDWLSTSYIWDVAVAPNGKVYLTGQSGKMGVYDPATGVSTDLSASDTGNWISTNDIDAVVVNSLGHAYVAGVNGMFGIYKPTTGITSDLRSADAGNWIGTTEIRRVAVNGLDNIYFVGYSGKFGFYTPPDDPLTDYQWSTVSWFVAETVAHSVAYGVYDTEYACSQTAQFYVEPAVVNGFVKKLNASTDQTGTYKCQNSTQGIIRITNTGTVGINISAQFDQVTSGVTMKVAMNDSGWQNSCNGVCNKTTCNLQIKCLVVNTTAVGIRYDLAQNATQEYWIWADFRGVAGTVSPTKGNMTTTAVKYGV